MKVLHFPLLLFATVIKQLQKFVQPQKLTSQPQSRGGWDNTVMFGSNLKQDTSEPMQNTLGDFEPNNSRDLLRGTSN